MCVDDVCSKCVDVEVHNFLTPLPSAGDRTLLLDVPWSKWQEFIYYIPIMKGYRFNKGMTILQTIMLSMTMTQIAQKKRNLQGTTPLSTQTRMRIVLIAEVSYRKAAGARRYDVLLHGPTHRNNTNLLGSFYSLKTWDQSNKKYLQTSALSDQIYFWPFYKKKQKIHPGCFISPISNKKTTETSVFESPENSRLKNLPENSGRLQTHPCNGI